MYANGNNPVAKEELMIGKREKVIARANPCTGDHIRRKLLTLEAGTVYLIL